MEAEKIYQQLVNDSNFAEPLDNLTLELAAVHRKPAVLRKPEIIAGESALRGAKLSTLLDGHPVDVERVEGTAFGASISAYSMLVPPGVTQHERTWLRAPAQVLARLDVIAGGRGVPEKPEAIASLTRVIIGSSAAPAATITVHLAIAQAEIFGLRSPLIARVAARLHAIASGLDPSGIAVPEVYLHRHRRELTPSLLIDAWLAGTAEGKAIAEAL